MILHHGVGGASRWIWDQRKRCSNLITKPWVTHLLDFQSDVSKKAWTVSALVEASILMLGTSMETAAGQKSHVEGIPRFELPVAVLNEAGLQLWRPASPSNATLSVFSFPGLASTSVHGLDRVLGRGASDPVSLSEINERIKATGEHSHDVFAIPMEELTS